MSGRTIEVLVVEDSRVAEELLVHELNADPELHVMGTAHNGFEALDFLLKNKPDVILMDLQMPKMDGFEATRRIMETEPVPVVAITATFDAHEVATNFRTMEAGAVALIEKPHGPGHPRYAETSRKMVETVKLMSEVKLVRRIPRFQRADRPAPARAEERVVAPAKTGVEIIAIGVSTGGPPVLQTLLSLLPKDLPVPVLIVQHIAAGFLEGMAEWLQLTSGFPMHIAVHGERLMPARAYLAPDGCHLGVGRDGTIALSKAPPEYGLRPAVSCLFRSVREIYGSNAAAVLLTGMGRDGADELKLLRDRGAITIAQDKESSLVHGMPGEAIRLEAATYVLPPDRIAPLLAGIAKKG
jgi:two-component system, chemotaxis family, protein-glutamate methylesterase/glutaminase